MEIKLTDLPKDLQGNAVIETKLMPIVCNACGKSLGKVEYIPSSTRWNHVDTIALCRDCWNKSGLQEVDWSKVPCPY